MTPIVHSKLLSAELTFRPVLEKMIELASPDKRNRAVKLLANIDQDIALHRDTLGLSNEI